MAELGNVENELMDADEEPEGADMEADGAHDIVAAPTKPKQFEEVLRKKRVEREKLQGPKPDPTQPLSHLPARSEWDTAFPRHAGFLKAHRFFVSNYDTCKKVVSALELDEHNKGLADGQKATVLEGYPGPGVMSRALLESDAVERVIAMEDNVVFAKGLENLQHDPAMPRASSALDIMESSAYEWDSYTKLLESGKLDHIAEIGEGRHSKPDYATGLFNDDTWAKPSPILFFAQLPNTVHSEQLLSQLLRAIPNRLWLFRYSRVRLALICSQHMAMRCLAPPASRLRGKLTMVAGAMADIKILLDVDAFTPHQEHFYPAMPEVGPQHPLTMNRATIRTKTVGAPQTGKHKEGQALMLIEPKVKPLVSGAEVDAFDYITKSLFILRSSSVSKALTSLAPGANNILNMMRSGEHPAMRDLGPIDVNPDTPVSELSLEEFVGLARMFERWPFRPANLFDEGRIEEIRTRL